MTDERRTVFGVIFLGTTLLLGACKRERAPQPQYPPQQPTPGGPMAGPGGYPPPQPAPTAAPSSPAPQPTPPAPAPSSAPPASGGPGVAPASGFACASDADLQCPFARCVNARCGGCASDAECKPLARCIATPLGAACVPSAGGSAPAPPATTTPAPTTPPIATAPPVTAPPAPDAFAAARARCLQRTNEYRARVSAPALGIRSDQLTCADNAARTDAAAKTPHGAFGQCNESAQNECPAFKGNVDTVIDRCLQMMFAEGPGQGPAHGHYTNMTNTNYRNVACGFHVTPEGAVWVVQNFYR